MITAKKRACQNIGAINAELFEHDEARRVHLIRLIRKAALPRIEHGQHAVNCVRDRFHYVVPLVECEFCFYLAPVRKHVLLPVVALNVEEGHHAARFAIRLLELPVEILHQRLRVVDCGVQVF